MFFECMCNSIVGLGTLVLRHRLKLANIILSIIYLPDTAKHPDIDGLDIRGLQAICCSLFFESTPHSIVQTLTLGRLLTIFPNWKVRAIRDETDRVILNF